MFFKTQDSKQNENTENTQIKYNPEKQTTQNKAKQNWICLKSKIHEMHEIQSLSRNPLSN